VRRRLVRVIATTQSAWSAAALGAVLEDPDFDVRRQVVRGLEDIVTEDVHMPISRRETIHQIASAGRASSIWMIRRPHGAEWFRGFDSRAGRKNLRFGGRRGLSPVLRRAALGTDPTPSTGAAGTQQRGPSS
jgi:hypothetical protein